MDDKRKNTRAYAKENPDVFIYDEFPLVTRKNNNNKKGEVMQTWRPRDSAHDNPSNHNTSKRTSYLSSKSKKYHII